MAIFGKDYASVYDFFYQDKDYSKECDFIEEIFAQYHSGKVKRVLDLGCGTGEHARILAKRGYKVVGVDCSKEMLNIAKTKAKREKLNIEFIKGNINNNIKLRQKFDAAISMFAVMNYQITNLSLSNACKIANNHLLKGGVFIFDCWYGPAILFEKPVARMKEVKINNEEKLIRFTEPTLDFINHTVKVKFKLLRIKGGKVVRENSEVHCMRFLFPQELKYILNSARFKTIDFYPFLELERTLTERDWNMVVIAKA